MTDLAERVDRALTRVDDPCSIAANAPVSLVDMGLILGREIGADGDVLVRMGVTGGGCMLVPRLVEAVEREVAGVDGVRSVRVEVDSNFDWTPELMADSARQALDARRAESIAVFDIKPQAWRNTSPR